MRYLANIIFNSLSRYREKVANDQNTSVISLIFLQKSSKRYYPTKLATNLASGNFYTNETKSQHFIVKSIGP